MGAENVARVLGTVFPWLIRIDVSFEPPTVIRYQVLLMMPELMCTPPLSQAPVTLFV